jgi:hypothetical protein
VSRNVSDRGGCGPSREVLEQLHREDLERHKRGEIIDARLENVRALTRDDIESMNQRWGTTETASAIAAAAAVQLANVRIATGIDDRLPALGRECPIEGPTMYSRLAEIDGATELTPADKAQLKSDTLRLHGQARHARDALRLEARQRLLSQIADIVGDERAWRIASSQQWDVRADRFPMPWFDELLKVPKHERRKALARALEELPDE